MQTKKVLAALSACALAVAILANGTTANAAISAQEAARLGADLTPLGAKKPATLRARFPAWDGGISVVCEGGFPELHARAAITRTRTRATSRSFASRPRTGSVRGQA